MYDNVEENGLFNEYENRIEKNDTYKLQLPGDSEPIICYKKSF